MRVIIRIENICIFINHFLYRRWINFLSFMIENYYYSMYLFFFFHSLFIEMKGKKEMIQFLIMIENMYIWIQRSFLKMNYSFLRIEYIFFLLIEIHFYLKNNFRRYSKWRRNLIIYKVIFDENNFSNDFQNQIR